MHSLGLNLEGNEVKDHEIDNISNSITGSPSSKYGVYIQRENRLQYKALNGHKSAHGPHSRDVTHILCKVTGLLLRVFPNRICENDPELRMVAHWFAEEMPEQESQLFGINGHKRDVFN